MSQASSEDSRIIKQQAFDIQKQCAKLSELCPDANICFLFLTEGKFYSFQTPNAWPIRATDIAGVALEEAKMPIGMNTASQPKYTQRQAEPLISYSRAPRPESPTLGDTAPARHVYGPGGIDILSSDADSPDLSPPLYDDDRTHTRESQDPHTVAVPLTDTEHSPEPGRSREQRRTLPESRRHSAQVISGSERHEPR
ncbi:hypothetical protein F5883DRAFT_580410 [Diaporthe sp. PMI_573]|nr:hypothetical protein F5883DRAFT_584642 [Diaporthaceae sp. PMI_573]KAH8749701.1 hypothetical protein F5883DRAFT_580410 [Diaporthaceae sp. PMI_573]